MENCLTLGEDAFSALVRMIAIVVSHKQLGAGEVLLTTGDLITLARNINFSNNNWFYQVLILTSVFLLEM